MGRRRGGLEDLLLVASKLPWKLAVVLAPVSYVGFHLVAAFWTPPVAATTLNDMGAVVLHGYVHTFASILQYVLPLVFLVGAAVCFVKRSRSIKLLAEAGGGADIGKLGWRDFERLIGEGFRHRGFVVTERGGAGPDGGVDLELKRGNERFLVQCKQWRAQQVTVQVVRELCGVMAAEHAAGGFVVTSGTFTKDAQKFAAGRNIELIDGAGLQKLIENGRRIAPVVIELAAANGPETAPDCPACKTPMVVRMAKRGANAGSSFWGCAQYPKCRQTMVMGVERRSA